MQFFDKGDYEHIFKAQIINIYKMPQILTCKTCKKEFKTTELEEKFYKRKNLPTPENCPFCREKLRLSLRNEHCLYKRTCDKCQKQIISTYRPDSKYAVYCRECFNESLI